jgi:hypothetical protein
VNTTLPFERGEAIKRRLLGSGETWILKLGLGSRILSIFKAAATFTIFFFWLLV